MGALAANGDVITTMRSPSGPSAIAKDGCPSCLVAAAQSTLADQQVADSSSLSNALFCDGD